MMFGFISDKDAEKESTGCQEDTTVMAGNTSCKSVSHPIYGLITPFVTIYNWYFGFNYSFAIYNHYLFMELS